MKLLRKIRFIKSANHFKGYAIHSPFIFGLVSNLIYCKHPFYSFGHLSQTYSQLSKTEKKAALSLKDGFRLFRLLNSIQPTRIKAYAPDKFDVAILSSFNKSVPKGNKEASDSIKSVVFVSNLQTNEWKGIQKMYGKDASVVFILKHPNTHQKKVWMELLQMNTITSSITFYGMGVAFTNVHLPKRNFKIVK